VIQLVDRKVFAELQDREQSFRDVCLAFKTRIRVQSGDKTDNPIVALAAGPGAGKSRFLDEFAAVCTDPQRLANVSDDDKELCDALTGCVPVRVTFNSYGSVHPIETRYGFDVVQALVYRMLFAQLCGRGWKYPEFVEYLHEMAPNYKTLLSSVESAVAQISNDNEQRPVLLLIDELLKAAPFGPPENLLSIIGAVLDGDRKLKFHALVSSLDPHVLGKVTRNSGRPVSWVRLPRLSRAGASAALNEYKYTFKSKWGPPRRRLESKSRGWPSVGPPALSPMRATVILALSNSLPTFWRFMMSSNPPWRRPCRPTES
jgi:hypothetical protein